MTGELVSRKVVDNKWGDEGRWFIVRENIISDADSFQQSSAEDKR